MSAQGRGQSALGCQSQAPALKNGTTFRTCRRCRSWPALDSHSSTARKGWKSFFASRQTDHGFPRPRVAHRLRPSLGPLAVPFPRIPSHAAPIRSRRPADPACFRPGSAWLARPNERVGSERTAAKALISIRRRARQPEPDPPRRHGPPTVRRSGARSAAPTEPSLAPPRPSCLPTLVSQVEQRAPVSR